VACLWRKHELTLILLAFCDDVGARIKDKVVRVRKVYGLEDAVSRGAGDGDGCFVNSQSGIVRIGNASDFGKFSIWIHGKQNQKDSGSVGIKVVDVLLERNGHIRSDSIRDAAFDIRSLSSARAFKQRAPRIGWSGNRMRATTLRRR